MPQHQTPPPANPPVNLPPIIRAENPNKDFVYKSNDDVTSKAKSNSTSESANQTSVNNSPNFNTATGNNPIYYNINNNGRAKDCMENVGCVDVAYLDIYGQYGQNNLTNRIESLSNAYSDQNALMLGIKARVPIGSPLRKKVERLGEEEIANRKAEAAYTNQLANLKALELHTRTVQMCINLKTPGKRGQVAVFDMQNASPVIANAYAMCQGVEVAMYREIPEEVDENARLREENEMLRRQLQKQPVRGMW